VSLATACRFSSTSSTDQRQTAELEALHGRPSRARFRTSSPFEVNSRTARTVDDNSPARNSRAHANCSELSRTRMFCGKIRRTQTEHNCSVARGQYRNSTGGTDDVTQVRSYARAANTPACTAPSLVRRRQPQQCTRTHQKAN